MEGMRRVRADRVIRRMRFVTAMAALGGFLFGYDTGVISGAMLPIRRAFSLTPSQEEVIVSSTILAAFLSSLVGGQINNWFGRRRTILLAASTFTIGALMLMLAWNYWTLVMGRVVVGIGIGLASLTTPIYLAEVAVPSVRGQLVTINAFLVTVGQFTAGMVDGAFDMVLPDAGWRYMLGLAAVPSITMFVGFLTLPESPRWLAAKGRRDEALQVLQYLRESDQEAQDELTEILHTLPSPTSIDIKEEEESNDDPPLEYGSVPASPPNHELAHQDHSSARLFEMLAHGPTRRALLVGCGIMLVQQCSGVNTVMVSHGRILVEILFGSVSSFYLSYLQYYAATIYRMSQFTGKLFQSNYQT
jgi:SP family myo-inositol transporter-like MFS transporter 13